MDTFTQIVKNITFVRWMDLEMANSLKSLHPFPPIDRTDHRRSRTLCHCQLTCFQQWYRVYSSQWQTSMLYTIRACFFQSQGPLLPLFTKKNKIPCWIAFFFPENGNFSPCFFGKKPFLEVVYYMVTVIHMAKRYDEKDGPWRKRCQLQLQFIIRDIPNSIPRTTLKV